MRTGTAGAAQYRDPPLAIQHCGQPVEIAPLGHHDRSGRQQAGDLGRRRVGGHLQCHVAWDHHHRHAAPADRLTDRDFEHTRHLVCAGDQLAVVAALLEQRLRVCFLEIAGADLGRRDLRGDRKHRHARSVAIEQAVDQVQIARPAAPRADGELTREMCLRTRREGGNLFVPDMHPLDLALAAK